MWHILVCQREPLFLTWVSWCRSYPVQRRWTSVPSSASSYTALCLSAITRYALYSHSFTCGWLAYRVPTNLRANIVFVVVLEIIELASSVVLWLPPVLWHCWLGVSKRPVENWVMIEVLTWSLVCKRTHLIHIDRAASIPATIRVNSLCSWRQIQAEIDWHRGVRAATASEVTTLWRYRNECIIIIIIVIIVIIIIIN